MNIKIRKEFAAIMNVVINVIKRVNCRTQEA